MKLSEQIKEIEDRLEKGGLTFEEMGLAEMELEGLREQLAANPEPPEEVKVEEPPVVVEEPVVEPKTSIDTAVKTHWKKLKNPDYLGSYDFQPGEERVVTVKHVVVEAVKTAEGTGDCVVVHFMENYKPMIMNTTNGKTLSKLFETPYIEEWKGRSFKLVVKPIKAFGEIVDALRVKNEKVARVKPELIVGSKTFVNCRARYLEDNTVLSKIEEHYWMKPETKTELTKKA